MTPSGEANPVAHSETAAKINFASHQSSFASLRELRIENRSSTERLEDLQVTLSSNPALIDRHIGIVRLSQKARQRLEEAIAS